MKEKYAELPWWNADGVDEPGDDIPELTEADLANANFYDGRKLTARRRRGRPASVQPKVQVTIRLSKDTLEKFRATGKGWQSRIDQILARAAAELS